MRTPDVDEEVQKTIADARRQVETRREMKSGQIKKTIWGDMKFMLVVDLPTDMPHENFIKNMHEYGNVLAEAFKPR